MSLSTRSIAVAGVLIAVTIVLALTGLGYFPVPNVTAQATILHVPAIIAGVLEGPVVGLLVGLVFGIDSYIRFRELPELTNQPEAIRILILLITRCFIGITAALTYRSLRTTNQFVALAAAGIIGTLTNTLLVLGLAVGLQIYPPIVFSLAAPQFIFEAVLAAIITVAVVAAWRGLGSRRGGSSV
jgi:uncharacterized membrane protein